MNDYGLFNAIRHKLFENVNFRKLTQGIYTQAPDDVQTPYLLIDFGDFKEDRPVTPCRILLQTKIKIVTQYHGLKELYQVITALHQTLEHQTLEIPVSKTQAAVKAQFRLRNYKTDILSDGYSRVGEIIYETRLSFEGNQS